MQYGIGREGLEGETVDGGGGEEYETGVEREGGGMVIGDDVDIVCGSHEFSAASLLCLHIKMDKMNSTVGLYRLFVLDYLGLEL